jgi:amidohydrolase
MKAKLTLAVCIALLTALTVLAARWPSSVAAADDAREQEIARAADGLRQKMIEQRRDFHMNPELSNREERTAKVVAERLRALGLDEVKTEVGKHGVVALLK